MQAIVGARVSRFPGHPSKATGRQKMGVHIFSTSSPIGHADTPGHPSKAADRQEAGVHVFQVFIKGEKPLRRWVSTFPRLPRFGVRERILTVQYYAGHKPFAGIGIAFATTPIETFGGTVRTEKYDKGSPGPV